MATQTGSIDMSALKASADIATNTEQYFWFNSVDSGAGEGAGAHITETPMDDFIDDPTNGGGNVLIDSDSVDVRDGTTVLATFGASGAVIGQTGKSRLEMDYNSMQFVDMGGDGFFEVVDKRSSNKRITYRVVGNGARRKFPLPVSINAVASKWMEVFDENGVNVSSSYPISCIAIMGGDYRHGRYIEFDNSHVLPVGYTAAITFEALALSLPLLSFGSRQTDSNVGYCSATIGYNLIASMQSQLAIGEYNVEDTEDMYPLIIGNGTADNARSNALTVDWDGMIVSSPVKKNIAYTGEALRIQTNQSNISTSAGQVSLTQSLKNVLPASKYDTYKSSALVDDLMSVSSGTVTILKAGVYRVSYSVYLYTGFTANDQVTAMVKLSDAESTARGSRMRVPNATAASTLTGDFILNVSANGTLQLCARNDTAARGVVALNYYTRMNIECLAAYE